MNNEQRLIVIIILFVDNQIKSNCYIQIIGTNRQMADSIKQFFIRPQRQTYYSFDLGPNVTFVSHKKCQRDDFQIYNLKGNKLTVSFYRLEEQNNENCLIYLHTHNGSKLQALPLIENILTLGVNICLFDFAGYGNSEGDTVSLGCKQIWDIQCVIQHLRDNLKQQKFILWGRSMGAVAALLYLSTKSAQFQETEKKILKKKELDIIGGIYDSPFYSLQKLTLQLGSKNSNLPQVLLKPFIFFLKNSLKDDINFEDLELAEKMKHIKAPGIFITSQNDNFVHYSHSQMLYRQYGGKKQLVYIEKDHNQIRKKEDLDIIYNFIKRINEQNPKRWQNILMNNLAFHKKNGKSVESMYYQ